MTRTLTAAFLVTTSMAGATACRTANPAPPVVPNAERATDARGVPLDLRADEVQKGQDGACYFQPASDCPPDDQAACNPPPAVVVDCPGEP